MGCIAQEWLDQTHIIERELQDVDDCSEEHAEAYEHLIKQFLAIEVPSREINEGHEIDDWFDVWLVFPDGSAANTDREWVFAADGSLLTKTHRDIILLAVRIPDLVRRVMRAR